jgi:hypothetical protein
MQVTGRELLAAAAAFATHQHAGASDYVASIVPVPSAGGLEPNRTYSLVATPDGVYQLPAIAHLTPRVIELTDRTLADAMDAMATARTLAP